MTPYDPDPLYFDDPEPVIPPRPHPNLLYLLGVILVMIATVGLIALWLR